MKDLRLKSNQGTGSASPKITKHQFKPDVRLITAIESGQNVFCTGNAGTGKTFQIQQIEAASSKRFALTATTGVAALNLRGTTIHSFTGAGIQTDKNYIARLITEKRWAKIRNQIRLAEIIVIDEISMMRSDLLELCDEILKTAMESKNVFGGKQVIVAGDFLQLAPVVRNDENLPRPWAFQSTVWERAEFAEVHLTTNFRQDDPIFQEALDEIRRGKCSKKTDNLFQMCSLKKWTKGLKPTQFFPTKRQVDEINFKNLDALKGDPKVFEADVWGCTAKLKERIIDNCPAPEHLLLKEGAQVMVLKNDTECSNFINGSMGFVVRFSQSGFPVVKIEKTSEEFLFEPETWEQETVDGQLLAYFKQIPLKLAWAVTVHKAQGLTVDTAEVDLRGVFTSGQAYVALSRARTLDGLYLKNWDQKYVSADPTALKFQESIIS